MTPSVVPTAKTWILRFKHHTTTILLHVEPLQQWTSVRNELLKAIHETNPSGSLNDHAIPDSGAEIMLARPVDINDLKQGWETIERDDDSLQEALADAKGKGKAAAGTSKARAGKNNVTDTPQGAGLRDGGVVAFKFRSEAEAEVDEGIELEEGGEDDGVVVVEKKPERWDVVVPTLEDVYGDERAGAGGGVDAEEATE
jgi:hypothetical protein